MAAQSRRDLIYRMRIDTEQAKKEFKETTGSVRGFRAELRRLEEQQKAVDQAMDVLGRGMVVSGAAIGLGLGLAAKAAIDWESAWTGVAKVVEGSPEQLAALEQELRGMAMVLPQTHAEIAGVAAAAGQLGIATEDITAFTEVMVAMGVATNLSSEEAATALARLMNIMGTAADDVDRLGSTIVGLGNTSATTEAEIVEMALRIAGAGETVGLTEAEVLGFAAALSSVGIEAEAGGSAISTAMVKISEAVNEGSDSLDMLARVAGVSAKTFATRFREDPAAAIDAFVQGLGRMEASGEDVFGVLNDLGLGEIRMRDALLRLANAGDLLNATLDTSTTAWHENAALMEEASRRYGTTEAQIQIARNQLVDLGISLGESLVPMLQRFLDVASGMMAFFNDLPGPVKSGIVVLGTVAAAVGLVGGAALIAVPKVHALNLALGEMGGPKASLAQKALRGLGGIMTGPWGIAIGAAVTVLGLFAAGQAESRARTDELSATLDEQTSAVTGNTKAWIANELEKKGALEAAQALGLDLSTVVDAIAGEEDALAEVNRVLAANTVEYETNTASITGVNHSMTEAEQNAGLLRGAFDSLNGELAEATASHQRQAEATGASAAAAADASGEALALSENLGITTEAAQEAADGFADLDQKVRALIDSAFALSGAQRDVEAGIDELTEKLQENGATVDRNTEAGRENEQAIEDQVQAIADLAITTAEQTGSTEDANAVLEEQRDRLHDVLAAAGLTEEQIQDYISVLDDVPEMIETTVEANLQINTTEHLNRIITEEFGRNAAQVYADGGIVGFPGGGMVRGPGGPRSDSILARVSNGEFVVNAAATAQNRELLEAINSGRPIALASSGTAGGNVYNINLRAYSGDFNLQQVQRDLAYEGVA